MKQSISPVVGGVIIAIVLAVALYFGIRVTGPAAKSNEPVDMGKLMGQGAPVAPPSNRPGGQNMTGSPVAPAPGGQSAPTGGR